VQARVYLHQSLTLREEIGDRPGIAQCYTNLGMVDYVDGRYEQAREQLQRGLDIKRETGEQYRIIYNLNYLGFVSLRLHDGQAPALFREALTVASDIQAISLVLMALVGTAALQRQAGDARRAAELVDLIQHHPALNSNVAERLNDLVSELDGTPPETEEPVNGRSLDLDAVVTRELAFLDSYRS